MTNSNRRKGHDYEADVALYLRTKGFDCWRMAQTGEFDQGDLSGSGGIEEWAFECRNRAKLDLAKNVSDANARADNKGAKFGITVMKRRGKSVADSYVAMDLETFAEVLKALYRPDDSGF